MKYKEIFTKKELQALLGNNYRNLVIATSLLVIAIFTVSLSLGAYQELKQRMDNPFTNWVTMPVLYGYRDTIPAIQKYFSLESNLNYYNLKDFSGFSKWDFKFIDPKDRKIKVITGRTLNFSDDITEKIFEPSNVIAIKDEFNKNDENNLFDLFVTEEFCQIISIDPENSVGKEVIVQDFDDDFVFLFRIGGILNTLPNHAQFIMSHDFANMFRLSYEETGFLQTGNHTRINLLETQELDLLAIEKVITPISIVDYEKKKIEIAGDVDLYQYHFYTSDFISDSVAREVINEIDSDGSLSKLQRNWLPVKGFSNLGLPMYVAFNFQNLERIRPLQEFLKETFNVEIELSVVEDRDNFHMVTNLTRFMIISLILISLVSFTIFLFNLIYSHLDKIKPNIGTFMAFGLSSGIISKIYSFAVLWFMAFSWGITIVVIFLLWLIGMITNLYNLNVFHPLVLITFVLFNIIAFVLTKYITGKFLNETPGDLIYNRI